MKDKTDRLVNDFFRLTHVQAETAFERVRDVVVTAGAGSGKTRTLVARYTSLLADGYSPRRVVAVTFTEKAAREMRSRVRDAVRILAQSPELGIESEQDRWVALGTQLDSARIGTIHSLCAELLRAHPAEAGIDPRFSVLDEGISAVLRAQAVEDTMTFLVNHSQNARLFEFLHTEHVRRLVKYLLGHRLEAREALNQKQDINQLICLEVSRILKFPQIAEPLAYLQSIPQPDLLVNENPKLAEMVITLREVWSAGEFALMGNDIYTCATNFHMARRTYMNGRVGARDSLVKKAVADLRQAYDDVLDPFMGGSRSSSTPPEREGEILLAELLPLVYSAFHYADQSYQAALKLRRALDFDDLEYGAVQLLKNEQIRSRWQAEVDALLVDEFQDTNSRQREIVEGLAGRPGKLFIVGDDRQSIYRFRRADVTVFKEKQNQVKNEDGLVRNLDQTYRAHAPLLDVVGDLLSYVMGIYPDPFRPFYVPYSPLVAARSDIPEHLSSPHVEIVYAVDENAEKARPATARALADRLLQLKQEGQIRYWNDVALLFRAASGFGDYEDAFEDYGIPFVTVSGRGFYDRPEIRDVLNILRALVNPSDDLALAGLLRSPAFGISDAGLYRLRYQNNQSVPYFSALYGDLSILDEHDLASAERTIYILGVLLPLVDRIPVADLLKKLVDITDYRAILATRDYGSRLWRNLDKLIDDALVSGQVNVRDFLQYLSTISDVGAREGEAPAEGQGAVRLMTIHKSKGLEFPLVVLADAGRKPRDASENAYLLPHIGLTFKLKPVSLAYSFSKWQDDLQNEAEAQRLLYVALTRAKDKLIISGHAVPAKEKSSGYSGWMDELANAAGLPGSDGQESPLLQMLTTSGGNKIRAWHCNQSLATAGAISQPEREDLQERHEFSLYKPLYESTKKQSTNDEPDELRTWRATGAGKLVPQRVIGEMFHKAMEMWLFPDNVNFLPFLESAALNAGLVSTTQRVEAVRRVLELLERFQEHSLWAEINTARERYHELPYTRQDEARTESGYIDLLYRTDTGWHAVDFKTEVIPGEALGRKIQKDHQAQMDRYASALKTLLGQPASLHICFLDYIGRVKLVDPYTV